MNDQNPEMRGTVPRSAIHGAWIGAVLGVALSLVLRSRFGQPEHYLVKTAAVIVIVAVFGAFVGVLVAEFARTRRGA